MLRLYRWRFGITVGKWGEWGVYLGVPFTRDTRLPMTPGMRGCDWIGAFAKRYWPPTGPISSSEAGLSPSTEVATPVQARGNPASEKDAPKGRGEVTT